MPANQNDKLKEQPRRAQRGTRAAVRKLSGQLAVLKKLSEFQTLHDAKSADYRIEEFVQSEPPRPPSPRV